MATPTSSDLLASCTTAWPIYDNGPIEDAFQLTTAAGHNDPEHIIATSVSKPWVFCFSPAGTPSNTNKAVVIFGGGGYTELHCGREGVQVAKWLNRLGFTAFVVVHRFPNAENGISAPLDDARTALTQIQHKGYAKDGLGVVGLSSGGHLAASLLCDYPATWKKDVNEDAIFLPKIDWVVVGYAPISTNAHGRQIIKNKPDLPPAEKQQFYNVLQPDIQIKSPAPPAFLVYSASDPVVPVVNAYRLAEGLGTAGRPAEIHVFSEAPHGFAIDTVGLPVSEWTGMCERWLKQSGFLA